MGHFSAQRPHFLLAAALRISSPVGVLQEIDTAIFRFINRMGSPALDPFITFFNGGSAFKLTAILGGLLVLWKGNRRARLCLLFLALGLAIGDGIICSTLKKSIGRQRPYQQFTDTRMPAGRGNSGSMPSSHAANMASIAIVLAFFYPRTRLAGAFTTFMVSLARVYSGVHFPSDVVAGVLLASIYTPAILLGAEKIWRSKAPELLPDWAERMPSLLRPDEGKKDGGLVASSPMGDSKVAWLKLGWVMIGATLVFRLLYIAAGKIELSEDEAYQWMWSKHLALSYYSKPPLIAYAQFLGTSLWGDTEFGIRFLSPILAAITGSVALILVARNFSERAAFFALAAGYAAPMLAAGATLMTIDALSVMFWTVAMGLVWRAIQIDSTRLWALAGVAVGFGLLAKYIALVQWVCVLLFLVLHAPARRQFARPGLYLAIAISLLGLLPVILWNQQNNWITLTHLNERSGLHQAWKPTYKYPLDFVLAEFGLLNPIFFGLAIWAAARFWKNRTALQTFLFAMGAPLFLGYLAYTLRSRVQPNWVAPAILPLFALAATYWEARWTFLGPRLKPWLQAGFIVGLTAVVFMHDTNLTSKILGFTMPVKLDPLVRLRGWSSLAAVVQAERTKLANEKPFIIGDHYGITSLMTFYSPETRKNPANNRLIYAMATKVPRNQYYFWPNYLDRLGENAIFVARHKTALPADLQAQFESFEYLGGRDVMYRGRAIGRVHLYLCRNLKAR